MTVDENFARVILRNPLKITVDKNHIWDKLRFFKISQFSVTYEKKSLNNDPINVTCYWVKPHSFTDRSLKRCQKKDSKMTRWHGLTNSWVKSRLFNRKITQNSPKNEPKLGHFLITKLNITTCHFKVILEWFSSDLTDR